MKARDKVLIYIASKPNKCATLDEIKTVIKSTGYSGDNIDAYAVKLLSRLKKSGIIKRSWVTLICAKKKKRIYCIDEKNILYR